METIKHKRQKFTYDEITKLVLEFTQETNVNEKDKKKKALKEFKSYIEKVGMLIYKTGLVNTMVYMKHKNETIYDIFKKWFTKEYPFLKIENNQEFIKALLEQKTPSLMMLTDEALLLSDALKEFTKAEIKTEERQ